jgi:hypothetical protein
MNSVLGYASFVSPLTIRKLKAWGYVHSVSLLVAFCCPHVFFSSSSSYSASVIFVVGTTVQCGPSPPLWTSSSQFGFLISFPAFNFASILICTRLHHLFFGRPVTQLPLGLLFNCPAYKTLTSIRKLYQKLSVVCSGSFSLFWVFVRVDQVVLREL